MSALPPFLSLFGRERRTSREGNTKEIIYTKQKVELGGVYKLGSISATAKTLPAQLSFFRMNRESVLAEVKRDARALEHASNELRADREIVLAAVKQAGCELQYASNELRWRLMKSSLLR